MNGGRMMSEIVHHENPSELAYDVLAPLYPIESQNRLLDALHTHSGNARGCDYGCEVPDIVPSRQPGPQRLFPERPGAAKPKGYLALLEINPLDMPVRAVRPAVGDHLPFAFGGEPGAVRVVGVENKVSALRD